ncbi:MAG: YgcG family protein [Mariniblastus sp.]
MLPNLVSHSAINHHARSAQRNKIGWNVRCAFGIVVMCLFLCASNLAIAQQAEREPGQILFTDIPSPRLSNEWVVDMTNTVSEEAIKHINLVCEEVNNRLDREMTVVVIPTTSGRNHMEYGTALFNHWGVGKPGVLNTGLMGDNGILLLAAIEDRRAALILGSSIDGPEQTRIAEQIIDDIVVANFKRGDGDSALYEGIRASATRIFSVADLDQPATLPSVSEIEYVHQDRKHKQRGPVTYLPWILGGGVVSGIGLMIGGRYYMRYRTRHCLKCSEEMIRLQEDQDDQFLDDPEQIEEHIGSVDYDIWACLKCEEVLKLRYGKLFTRYSKCPKCWYITIHKIEKTLVYADYDHGGKVSVTEDCKSCDFHRRYTYSTPRKQRPSSNSSSGSSFGGGSSSGSSSSGFSGGSSSGGGASGGW